MAELNRFVFYGEWIDNIKKLPVEEQDRIIADIVRYGIGEDPAHAEDPMVQSFVNFSKGAIDKSKGDYLQKIAAGKKFGRKKSIDDAAIWSLAQEGLSSADIAVKLSISKSSVDHRDGWRQRKNTNFLDD